MKMFLKCSYVRLSRRGFTLIEIMIVVAVIGVLLLMAIPNYSKNRESAQKKSCIANLKTIDSSKEIWAMEKGWEREPAWAELVPEYLKTTPVCPTGGEYRIGAVQQIPTCSVPEHKLVKD